MFERKIKSATLNPVQMYAVRINEIKKVKNIFLEWGRGAGKSTIFGWYMKECVRQMPRSTGVLVGETYQQILSRTLPSTKEGLSMFGLYEGFDYVVGKSGIPLGFETPFQSPSSWRNTIHFKNGAIAEMVSNDMPNAGRGINSYWVLGDEAGLLDQERLFTNVQTTNRAKKSEFSKSTLLNAEIFASSTPLTKKGKWFTNMEQESKKAPNQIAFIKANAMINWENLSADWFDKMKTQSPSQLHYNAEIKNIRPSAVVNGFYAFFNDDIHTYSYKYDLDYLLEIGENYSVKNNNCRQDGDLVKGVPLSLVIDPGTAINSATVWQYLSSINEERALKEFFVKSPKDWEDLMNDFDAYYEEHKKINNTLYLRHDAQAFKERDKNGLLISAKMEKKLRDLGWRVINHTPKTNNPLHSDKFTVLNTLLKEKEINLPKVRINRDNCPNLIISIQNAETEIKATSDFGKDKSSERDSSVLPEHATHLSDTFDYYLYWRWVEVVRGKSSGFFISIS